MSEREAALLLPDDLSESQVEVLLWFRDCRGPMCLFEVIGRRCRRHGRSLRKEFKAVSAKAKTTSRPIKCSQHRHASFLRMGCLQRLANLGPQLTISR